MKKAVRVTALYSLASSTAAISVNTPRSSRRSGLLPRGGTVDPDETTAPEAQPAPEPAVPEPATSANNTTTPPASGKKKRRKRTKKSAKSAPSSDDSSPAPSDANNSDEPTNSPEPAPQTSPFVEEILQHDDYYQLLGIAKTASSSEVTKAYRRRAVQTHPDKTGGDRRAFDKISEAYNVLSDKEKRQIYNRHGKRGLEQGGGGAGSSFADMFRHFQQQQQRSRPAQTYLYQMPVDLEDLYNGRMGKSVELNMPGGGRIEISVDIEKGMVSGERIAVENVMPGDGDAIVELVETRHPTLVRKGHDLALRMEITLQEALCGVQREIKHVGDRILRIQSSPSELIQTGDVQVLKGEGMPKGPGGEDFGDLYIQYEVKFPTGGALEENLSTEERSLLGTILSKLQVKAPMPPDDTAEPQVLEKASINDFGRSGGRPRHQQQRGRGGFYSQGFSQSFGGAPGGDDGSNVQCQQM